MALPEQGEIWWADLGRVGEEVVGHEQAGRRPVLLVSTGRYHASRGLALTMPLTTNDRLIAPIAVELPSHALRRSFALPGQTRTLSLQRLESCVGAVALVEVQSCLDALLLLCGRRPAQWSLR